MINFQLQRSKRHNFLINFLKLIGSLQITFYNMNRKFQGKIFTSKEVIKLWNFCNFGIHEIIPKSIVTLRFSKISLHGLKGSCKCFQMSYWPHFYVDPTHSNAYFLKVGKWQVLLQGTVLFAKVVFHVHQRVRPPTSFRRNIVS